MGQAMGTYREIKKHRPGSFLGGLLTWPVGHNLGHRQALEEVRAVAALFAVVDGCVVNFPDALRVG